MTKQQLAEEVVCILDAIDLGEINIYLEDDKQDLYCNNVRYRTLSGWKFVIFIDCDEWDYIDSLTAPTGETLDYDEINTFPLGNWEPKHPEYWLEAKVKP